MLSVGNKAPDFTLMDETGREISLSDFKGKKVVIYFYPKDDTPGCTKEACSFRDVYDDILAAGAVVIGISKDDTSSHQKFKNKYNLPFYLLSDPDHKVIEKYGAWQEKKMYGKTSMGTARITYIVDEEGVIKEIYHKVKPENHGEEILEALKNI
ncbi:MAG: thioredoxin-dependent thiol peroxidase [Clostridiales bacterium]|jgi:peroxiredoxin Q/BCP|nr:thioredoxin-dependent thiol peroxidase [Clostridiales bacterium]